MAVTQVPVGAIPQGMLQGKPAQTVKKVPSFESVERRFEALEAQVAKLTARVEKLEASQPHSSQEELIVLEEDDDEV